MKVDNENYKLLEDEAVEEALQPTIENQYSNLYILYSFIACFCYGTGNFMCGYLSMKYGIIGCLLPWVPYTLFWIMYHFWKMANDQLSKGSFFVKAESIYYDKNTLKFSCYGMFLLLQRSFISIGTLVLFYASQSAAAKAGFNQGIVTVLFSISIVFSAIMFYFFYNEKLNCRHALAIFCFICAVILLGANGEEGENSDYSELNFSKKAYTSLAIFLSLLLGFFFALTQIHTKYIQAQLQQSPLELAINIGGFYFPYTFPLFCYYYYLGNQFELSDFLIISGGCFALQLGLVFNVYALMMGPGGVIFAITNLCSIVQTLWIVVLQGIIPTIIQVVALVLALFGSSVITELDKYLLKKNG